MEAGPLAEQLIERFEAMPLQLKGAARFVLEHPRDVALMSMREQAQRAGVSHTTMMRLSRLLGLNGYEDVRSLYAQALRESGYPFHEPRRPGETGDDEDPRPASGDVADSLAAQVASLGEYGNAEQFDRAAEILVDSRNLFSLGLRAEHAVAYHFVYILSLLGSRVTLLDAIGGTGADALRYSSKGDAVLVVGLRLGALRGGSRAEGRRGPRRRGGRI